MKNIIYILAMTGLLFSACSKIDEPYLEETGGSGPGPAVKVRKILMEEFTGHLCVNCPEATKLANDLKQVYGEQLVLIAIHSGDFALPSIAPYEADFRTTAGTDISNHYQPLFVPSGMVNRMSFDGNTVMFKDDWEPAIQELKDLPPEAYIEIESEYNETTRKLDLHIHSEFLQDVSRTCNLSVLIIESGIISPQKNDEASVGPKPDWLDYEHRHLLRTAVNGTWGDFLADQPTSGTIMTKDYSITLNSEWDANECAVVAIVIDGDTYEVIQVEESEIL